MTAPFDWSTAVRSAQRRIPRGPHTTLVEARQVTDDLYRYARDAERHVRQTTGLGLDLPIAEAHVVDRRGWVAAAAESMAVLTAPLTDALSDTRWDSAAIGGQVGWLLGYLSARILGQFDPVGTLPDLSAPEAATDAPIDDAAVPPAPHQGRLLLVAPNVLQVEREIGANPADFRLWVCLHESTHRLQFSAHPWMTPYFRGLVAEYGTLATDDPKGFISRAIPVLLRRRAHDDDAPHGRGTQNRAAAAEGNWLRRIQTPEQRRVFDQLMALMTLLEGHADFIMDEVGPSVVPSVAQIRSAFTRRRAKRRGPLDRLVRSLIDMDMKMAQYARGAEFVRRTVHAVGMEQFNTVFTSPQTLPTWTEIGDPDAWMRRVLSR